MHEHYRQLLAHAPALYHPRASALLAVFLVGALWFANASNAGKFFERLPFFFDFFIHFQPDDPLEIVRAMFDLPSPYDDGSLKYDYPEGRVALFGDFYLPEYFYELLVTINIAVLSTMIGATFALRPLLLRRHATWSARAPLRFVVRRLLELLRAFPEIVIAGLLVAIFSIGPIGAIAAVAIHTIGALGKLFLRGGRERRHAARRRAAGGRRQLVRARALRHGAAGAAQLHLLRAAAHRDQRARLDHHRRGRRRRHRRDLPAARSATTMPPRPTPSSSCCS